jgi:hypothetical protein
MRSALAVLALSLPLLGCPTSRSAVRCSIVASPVGAERAVFPPQLTSMARNPTDKPVPMSLSAPTPVRCTTPPDLPAYLRGSPVDDLTALWVGGATVNGQARRDCPVFPTKLSVEAPTVTERPCGESACPNQQVAFGRDGVRVHVLFYDDPSRHDLAKVSQPPSGACYYRVYAVSVAWDGEGPQ